MPLGADGVAGPRLRRGLRGERLADLLAVAAVVDPGLPGLAARADPWSASRLLISPGQARRRQLVDRLEERRAGIGEVAGEVLVVDPDAGVERGRR
jgi:hypothetical protein